MTELTTRTKPQIAYRVFLEKEGRHLFEVIQTDDRTQAVSAALHRHPGATVLRARPEMVRKAA